MSDAETYLRELRRALPVGYRRRFVAEVRDHFESAVAAEAGHGMPRPEAERLTIERLGPPRAVADQLVADLRSGALGPVGRLSAALTATRLAAVAVLVLAVGVAVAVIDVRSTAKTPTVQRAPESPAVRNGVEIRRIILTLTHAQATKQQWVGVTPVRILRLTQTAP